MKGLRPAAGRGLESAERALRPRGGRAAGAGDRRAAGGRGGRDAEEKRPVLRTGAVFQ